MNSIKQNFFYNFLFSISQVLFPLVTFPYLARIILPNGIGEINFVESVCRYIILFSALGIPIYGVREIAKYKDDQEVLNKLFSELLVIHFINSLIFISISFFIILYNHEFFENRDFYLVGFFLIFSEVFSVEWCLKGLGKFKFIAVRSIVLKLILTLLVFGLIKEKSHSIVYFILLVSTSVINSIVNYYYTSKFLSFTFNIQFNSLKKHVKPLLLIFSSIAFVSLYTLLDTIILGLLTDNETVGYYSTGVKISRIPITFITAIGVVLVPNLSSYYHSGKQTDFDILISRSLEFILMTSVPLSLILFNISDELVLSFAGIQFDKSIMVLKILSTLVILIGLSNIFGLQILTTSGKDKYFTYSVMFGMFAGLFLNFLLIPYLNEIGAAISTLVAEFVVTLSSLYYVTKFFNLKFEWDVLYWAIISSIPIPFIHEVVAIYFIGNNIAIVILTVVLSLASFFVVQLVIAKNRILVEIHSKISQYFTVFK